MLANWWRDLSVSKKLYSVVGLMALLIASELVTLLFAMNTLSAVRAFVMGEGLWTKAQKDALHSLYQYAGDGTEQYFSEFQEHLKIPAGDHKARLELSKPNFDYSTVWQGFDEGGNNPHDIDGMIKLLVRFHDVSYIRDAITAWNGADEQLAKLRLKADDLHQAVLKRATDLGAQSEVAADLNDISRINSALTDLETAFSASLGDGSRWLEQVLMLILICTVFTVEGTGIYLTFRFSRTLGRSLAELQNVTTAVSAGNFSVRAPVDSKDELGQLARSINNMIGELQTSVEARTAAGHELQRLNDDLEVRVTSRARDAIQREMQLRVITNALPELVAHLDLEERFMFANDAFCRWFNLQPNDVIGKTYREILGEERYQMNRPHMALLRTGQTVKYERESKMNGSSAVFDVTFVPERDEDGHVMGFILVAVDVTKYKNIELELKKAKELADSASATKSAFLANMSHEIRTPLGAILGYSELMARHDMSSSERNNSVEVIKRNGRLLSNIINDILDISKVEAGKLQTERVDVSFDDAIEEIESILDLEASGKGIKLVIKSEGAIPSTIRTDPLRLRQILLNIVGNAIKFTDKGSVEVLVKMLSGADGVARLAFVIKDTGKGIEPEHIARLFAPFTQADPSITRQFGGTGLGLILAKKLANALGGDVILTASQPHAGSTFTVTIDPGVSERVLFDNVEMIRRAKTEVAPYKVQLNQLKILVVDDSADNLTLVAKILRFAGAKVVTALSGKEAIKSAEREKFSLVLMDLQMPGMDGFETTRALRGSGFDGPIIALTAHAMKEERRKCLEFGFDDHVSKPIDSDLLLKTISQHVS